MTRSMATTTVRERTAHRATGDELREHREPLNLTCLPAFALRASARSRRSSPVSRAEADKLVGCMSWVSTRAEPRPSPCSPTRTAASSARAAPAAANLQTEGELEVEKILHTVIERATDGQHVDARRRLPRHGRRRSPGRRAHHSRRDAAARLPHQHADRQRRADRARRRRRRRARVSCVISGTGSIAYGVSHHGVAARAGGWGPTLGDEGSGYWIGRRALAAVMRDADGRGPQTDLTPAGACSTSRWRGPRSWSRRSITSRRARRAIASLGAVVDRRARERRSGGDRHHAQAADELALAAASVISRLDMRGEQFPILLAGGMLRESVWLSAEVRRRMAEVAPRAIVGPLTRGAGDRRRAAGARRSPRRRARAALRRLPFDRRHRSEHRTL